MSPQTEVIYVDFEADDVLSTFECRTDQSTCPGGAILGAGCSIPACSHFSSNPYGKCECEGQLFINSECHEGFYCTENNPDPYLYDGCVQRCYQNQVLQPDFATKSWKCVNADQQPYCAGDFNLECTDHEPADGFNQDMCECEGQILISADCARGFYCRSRFVNGGVTIECPEGETIHANFDEWSYRCEADEISHCPGLGGFKAGCRGGNLEIPPLECDFQKNNLGECGCEGQIFVNNDCTETHLCTRIIPGGSPEGADGCHLSCPDGQKAYIDLHSKVWECREETPDYVCTGKFQTDCESDGSLNVMCGCENELWVNSDCDNAFFCTAANPGDQRNEGFFVSCPAGQVIDLGVWNPDGYQCTEETDRCPGQSYHFGCEGGDLGGIFTQAPTTNPGNGSTSWSGSLLMVVLSAFFVAFCRA